MSSERDIQSIVAPKTLDTLTITAASAPETVDGIEIDTLGFRGVCFAIVPDEAVGTDVIAFSAKEATITGGTFTVVAADKILPRDAANLNLTDAIGGFTPVFGVFSTERFVKPSVITTTVADDLTISVIPILIPENQAFGETGIDGLP